MRGWRHILNLGNPRGCHALAPTLATAHNYPDAWCVFEVTAATSPGDAASREVMDAGSRRAEGVLMFSISTTVDGVFHSDNVEPRMLLGR